MAEGGGVMATGETAVQEQAGPAQAIREAAAALAAVRERPCLLYISRTVDHADILTVRHLLTDWEGDTLDLIVGSPGGDIEAAYFLTRELKRRVDHLNILVPFRAKSAATLLCLAADELVLGSLGELGPLDQQCDEKQKADSPLNTSRLLAFKALEQLQEVALDLYDSAVTRIAKKSGMRLCDSCAQAAELTRGLLGPLYAQLDPLRIADNARGLEIGCEFADRILRRYRAVDPETRRRLIHRLIHTYPTHSFALDLEELTELGLPARSPSAEEAPHIEALGLALIEFGTDEDLIELVSQLAPRVAVVRQASTRLARRRRDQPPVEPALRPKGVRAKKAA